MEIGFGTAIYIDTAMRDSENMSIVAMFQIFKEYSTIFREKIYKERYIYFTGNARKSWNMEQEFEVTLIPTFLVCQTKRKVL
jgi:hypothetical protein